MDFPFGFDRVWDAAHRVFEISKWRVKKVDKAAGRYEVLVSIPTDTPALPIPFLERFHVDMARINGDSTRVHAAIRFGEWHWGTTVWFVNTFFAELQRQLASEH